MKKLAFFPLALILFWACQRQYLPSPVIDDGRQISMKVEKDGTNNSGDTTLVERGVTINFSAVSNGPDIASWQWTFDSTENAAGANVSHIFLQTPPKTVLVELTGITSDGTEYKTSGYFKVVWSADGLPAVKVISSVTDSSGSGYNIILAFNKAGMRYSGSQYFYIGNMSNWKAVNVAPSDTNYIVVSDTLVSVDSTDMGKYIAVRLNKLSPGDYQMGVGKIVNGSNTWGNFYDSTMVHFSLLKNGNVVLASDTVNATIPGSIGDKSANAVLRFDISDTVLTIYTNNQQKFSESSPFVALEDSNGVWYDPLPEEGISGYPDWGKITISMNSLHDNMLVMRFGSDISSPKEYSSNMPQSTYWDGYYLVLKAMFIRTSLKSSKNGWTVQPVK